MEAAVIPVVEEQCQKLIQLSFAKIVNCKQQRGGARLHKSLMVLHVLQKAKDEQRNKSYSESDIMEAMEDPSEDEVDEDCEEEFEDCFGRAGELDRCRSQSAQELYVASSRPSSPPPVLHELEPFVMDNDQFEFDSAKVEVENLDASSAMWHVLSSARSVSGDSDYSYSFSSGSSIFWPSFHLDAQHSDPCLYEFLDSNSAQLVDTDVVNNNRSPTVAILPSSYSSASGSTGRDSFREPLSPCATSSPMKRKSSYAFDAEDSECDQNDSGYELTTQACSSPKRVCQSPTSFSQLQPAQVLKDQNCATLMIGSSTTATAACGGVESCATTTTDTTQNLSDLICVFNSSLNTTAAASPLPFADAQPTKGALEASAAALDGHASEVSRCNESCSNLHCVSPQQRHYVELTCRS